MSPVDPRCGVTPALNGSVLLVLRCTVRCVRVVWESTAISLGDSMSSAKASGEGQVNSPARMNPKAPRQKAAHSIVQSKLGGFCDHAQWMPRSNSGVIGRRLRLCPVAASLRTPLSV